MELSLPETLQVLALDCLLHANQLMEVSETSSPLDYRLLSKVMKANLCHLGSHMTQVRTHLYVYYIKLVWTVEQDLIATVYQRENSYEK